MHAPPPSEYGASFAGYIAKAQTVTDPITDLHLQRDEILTLLRSVNQTQWQHRYAPGKWTLQELLGHMTDTERIFAYRALRIARADLTPLPGFEQDPYVAAAESNRCDPALLLDEFELVRRSTILMCRNFPDAAWTRIGTASNGPMSTRAMIYILLGHAEHHLDILRQRYL
ncbi:MAG: DinB family protein [Bryobacteraceae bacterium]